MTRLLFFSNIKFYYCWNSWWWLNFVNRKTHILQVFSLWEEEEWIRQIPTSNVDWMDSVISECALKYIRDVAEIPTTYLYTYLKYLLLSNHYVLGISAWYIWEVFMSHHIYIYIYAVSIWKPYLPRQTHKLAHLLYIFALLSLLINAAFCKSNCGQIHYNERIMNWVCYFRKEPVCFHLIFYLSSSRFIFCIFCDNYYRLKSVNENRLERLRGI